jgi:DNA-binding NarL/FixJ family response regulator
LGGEEVFLPAFWEEVGILGPVYHLAGQGLSDREIANALNITELNVQGCVAWILHFLQFADRKELIRYASVRAGL